jgi:SAM-dependent methyltransferase
LPHWIDFTEDITCRNYNVDERDSGEYRSINDALQISRGPHRNWEYPAALKALGDCRNKRILSIGPYRCALSLYLSHFGSRFVAVDRVAENALRDWQIAMPYPWSDTTEFVIGDFSQIAIDTDTLPLGGFDRIISVSSIEHCMANNETVENDNDMVAMERVGKLLAPGGRAVITIEWGYESVYEPKVIGGWCYNVDAIKSRLEYPSGLQMTTRYEDRPISWERAKQEYDAVARCPVLHAPGLIVLEHKEDKCFACGQAK